jgi:hypothetical protein
MSLEAKYQDESWAGEAKGWNKGDLRPLLLR